MSNNEYKSIFKTTIVYGAAQLLQMIITIVRAKFIAIILGSVGMGINALLQSSLYVIFQISNIGLNKSSVREISLANEKNKDDELNIKIGIFTKLLIITAIAGFLITGLGSPLLSRISFDSYKYIPSFLILAIGVFFFILDNGYIAIMQGVRSISNLTRSSVLGALLSLLIGLPFYYLFGNSGIAPAIAMGYMTSFAVRYYFLNKIKRIKKVHIKRETIKKGSLPMIKLGLVLMGSSLMITFFNYSTNIFISLTGDLKDVGFYQSAASIASQSLIIITTVLSSDFYPRLASVYNNWSKANKIINDQSEIITLIITPIVLFIIAFTPFIVKLLLSSEFLIVTPLLRCLAIAIFFRCIWMLMSYIILSRGDKKNYFIYDAIIGNGLNFTLNILAYKYYGLMGLGYSSIFCSIFVSLLLLAIVRIKYRIRISFSSIANISYLSLLIAISILNTIVLKKDSLVINILLFLSFIIYSLYILNKRIGIRNILSKIIVNDKK